MGFEVEIDDVAFHVGLGDYRVRGGLRQCDRQIGGSDGKSSLTAVKDGKEDG